ncbi:MAG: PIN domain-containing protein [Candidatus Electrothrix sp. AR4]|nr:PIN domain-containing protein [Candidatus Electrothrix sp. AR4]
MKVLFDTNVILDVLLDREPFAMDAAMLMAKVERIEIIGFICATTVTSIPYLACKTLGPKAAFRHIQSLLTLFSIAPVNRLVLENACATSFSDFEGAIIHEAAIHAGAQHLVTRNISDFKKASLPVYEPREFLNAFELLNKNG